MGAVTARLPLVKGFAAGVPSLNMKSDQVSAVLEPSEPTTLNLMKINVPAPESGVALNATIRIWPGVEVLGVMLHP